MMPTVAPVPDPEKPSQLMIPVGLSDDGTEYKFQLPPLDLLKESPPPPARQDALAQEKQAILMQTLNDFKIGANVAQVAMGPTITRYEVQLEPGILVKKIVALADNLAMSLAAIDVRVEAPIPGKAAIGIEVPNDVTQLVSLRECLSTNEFMNAPSKLTFALGKDVAGNYKYADLTKMPHLLVGGSTNSGKSVCLNVIISSILYRATPREVKFVMIDPKRVELSLYDGIPHLLSPVIKDVKHAAGIFRSVLKEMEGRYDLFARIGTRNIEGFNNRVPPEDRLPFIVVVVDELADLMMQMGAEVETSICRLAQLARATGIHLVIATQRPSVDVVTGTIKANISSRIAFAVATQIDSRTIIDQPGADRLIGRGDMLYMPIDAAKPVRVQGCYVGERETEELVKYLRNQEEAVYTMIPSETSASGTSGDFDDDGSSDELFEPAVRWLVVQGSCSTSSLQRKFKIGYTRAARLVETMEARGIVGSQDGVKPREILLQPQNVEAFFAGSGQGDFGQG
jgi:S-DNA-T family DNA segregation ATPase FtsK/SpoIIIE